MFCLISFYKDPKSWSPFHSFLFLYDCNFLSGQCVGNVVHLYVHFTGLFECASNHGTEKKKLPFSSRQWNKMLLSFHQNWVWSSSYSNLKSIEPFVDIVVTVSKRFVQQKWEGIGRGEGYFLAKFSLLVCPPVPQILTLFQTKICP